MIQLILAIGFFASAIPMSKFILTAIPVAWYVALRTLCAGLILLATAFYRKEYFSLSRLKRDIFSIILISFVLTFLPNMFKAYSLKHLTAAKASFFIMLSPFFSALFAFIIFDHRLSLKKFLGILLGCAGFYILMIYDAGIGVWQPEYLYPCIAGLLAIASIRLGLAMTQHVLKKEDYSPVQLNGLTLFFTGLVSCGLALRQSTFNCAFEDVALWQVLLCSLYVIIVGTVLWSSFYGHCLKRYTVTLMALLEFSTPIFVSLYGWLLFGEELSINFFIAIALTFLGLYIFYYDELQQEVVGASYSDKKAA
jgi:drug/metabolite transporter (DMT)-like permease